MSALAAARTDISNKGPIFTTIGYKAAASQTFYNGALVALNTAGYLVPAAATAGLRVVGVCDLGTLISLVTDGTVGSSVVSVKAGIFPFACGTSTNVLTIADLGNDVYVQDDQTVNRLPGTTNVVAGQLVKVESAQFFVAVGFGAATPGRVLGGPAAGTAYQGDGSVEAISAAGALSVATQISTLAVTGTTAYTLANGLFPGQRKIAVVISGASTPAGTITPATASGFTAVAGLGVLGETTEFIWTGAAWVLAGSGLGGVTVS